MSIRKNTDLHHRQLRYTFPRIRARLAVQVILKLLAKLLHKAQCGHGRGIAKRAEGAAQHVFGQVLHVVNVARGPETGVEARE